MVEFANCKINLGLHITGVRPDGYHDISTVMVPLDWHDIVEAVPLPEAGDDVLVVSGNPVDCPPEKNLVMKAVGALREVADFPAVELHLHKIVPDGAGLGGGSADAAFTVKAVDRLFGLNLSPEVMERVLAGVGSDCPFFVRNRPALATGTGTCLEPVHCDLSAYHIVVAKSAGVSVSTREAYALAGIHADEPPLADIIKLPVEQWQGLLVNDFEEAIFRLAPQVRAVKESLLAGGAAYASMTGSGAAVYGLFDSADKARKAAGALSGCAVFSGPAAALW